MNDLLYLDIMTLGRAYVRAGTFLRFNERRFIDGKDLIAWHFEDPYIAQQIVAEFWGLA